MPTDTLATPDAISDDAALAQLVAGGDHAAFAALMRRHNGKLFRIARATLGDDAEAEDALQDAYLDAYRHMHEFRGGAALGTWLTRIVINRALMRLRSRRRRSVIVLIDRRSAGFSSSVETSRSPYTVIASVRGIGVAVITNKSGTGTRSRSFARCSTPNLCCSSITTRPSRSN